MGRTAIKILQRRFKQATLIFYVVLFSLVLALSLRFYQCS